MQEDEDNSTSSAGRPAISVIVAVRNAASTIGRCLDSIAAQQGVQVELLVVDGASTDGTREIIQRGPWPLSHLWSEPDAGIYDAWNKALGRATGDWVCFLGADDRFASSGSLRRMADAAGEAAAMVFARAHLVGEDGHRRRTFGRPWDWSEMRQSQRVVHSGCLHRRELFERFGRFDTRYKIAGDYEFLLRLGPELQAAFVDEPVVDYAAGGMSSQSLQKLYRELRQIQAAHPQIGPWRAWRNYCRFYPQVLLGRLLRKRGLIS